MTEGETGAGRQSLEAWAFVRRMLDDMTAMVTTESETELELLEGLRVLGRVTALCSELALDVDPQAPWFFSMNSEARLVGGPNPDGEYHLAMIDGRQRYRVTGRRGTVTYLGFQVLAGRGLTPRRQAAYVSDPELELDDCRHLLPGAGRRGAVGRRAGRVDVGPHPRGRLGGAGAPVRGRPVGRAAGRLLDRLPRPGRSSRPAHRTRPSARD